MTIKQKVRISNIMMVLIPIVFTTIVIAVSLNTSLGSYWHTLESMYSDENGIQFAQSMIYTYQQELWENNWGEKGHEMAAGEITWSDEMSHMEHKLSGMGYHFMIEKNGNLLYSNLSEEDMKVAWSVAGDAIDSAKTLTASRHEVSVIKDTFYHGDKAFSITAVHRVQTDMAVVNYLKNYILKYLLGFVAFFVGLTVCVNGVMSWWISKSILTPLKRLSCGTKEIRDGNLDKAVVYEKPDEFGQVCSDFEEMRAYLQESVVQRLRDEKRRKDLIIGISHDLRTPLTSISGYVDGLLDGIASTPEKQRQYLEAIKTRTGNMVELVNSLSEYCRLDQDFHYHLELADLKSFLEYYMETCEQEARQNHVKITFVNRQDVYPVRIDWHELKRVFDNLLSNTVRYRTKDTSQITISLNRVEEEMMIEIIFGDDGPGVPKESLERIFDSFYRVDASRSKSEEGSGIGLAVVKEIISGHGGTVRAENREGLSVIIQLPMVSKFTAENSFTHGKEEKDE